MYKIFFLLLISLLTNQSLLSQIVNEGIMYVDRETELSLDDDFVNSQDSQLINNGITYVYKNFSNFGTVDFVTNIGGVISLSGSDEQTVDGDSPFYLFNLIVDNSFSSNPSITLKADLEVENESYFYEGIIDNTTNAGNITFKRNSAVLETSNNSHVDGKVFKQGQQEFTFPTGDKGFYSPVTISSPSIDSDLFSAQYFFDNVNNLHPISKRAGIISYIDNQQYWIINREFGNSNVLLTLPISIDTTPSNILNSNGEELRIVTWDEEEQFWKVIDSSADLNSGLISSIVPIVDGGVYALGKIKSSIILPGNVIVYNAVSPNNDGMNDYFFIENINELANNNVQIYNRWGVKVFETRDYDSSGNVFDGSSNGRATITSSSNLPSGNYFYIIEYDFTENGSTKRVSKSGYLYLTTN